MRRAWIAIGLLIPASVYALEFRDLSKLYLDAPFPTGDAAGISLLTSLGAVQGDPDGNFHPRRTLNRAEFIKIALLSSPKLRVSTSDAGDCFPDVKKSDWFSPYVCLAKTRGMVAGYPDGRFKPAQPVNYAEALKILGQMYGYLAYSAPDEPWYMGFVRAAEFNKTALPIALAYDRPLTRAQMARLAAAFRAQADGELATYRLAEKDLNAVIAMQRQSSSSKKSSSVSSVSSVSSSSLSSSSIATSVFPPVPRLILLGSGAVIAEGFFGDEPAPFAVRNATVVFKNEPKNLAALTLVTEDGQEFAVLKHDTYDQSDRTWKAQSEDVLKKIFPAEGANIGVKIRLKERATGGFAAEIIQVKSLSLSIGPAASDAESHQKIPTEARFPAQQTVQSLITSVRSALPPFQPVTSGSNLTVAAFTVRGTVLPGAELSPTRVTFTLAEQTGVSFDSWRASLSGGVSVSCSVDTSTTIVCENLPPPDDATSGVFTVDLRANVRYMSGVAVHAFRIDLVDPGAWGPLTGDTRPGAIVWSDGSGTYPWVMMKSPLARGSEWK